VTFETDLSAVKLIIQLDMEVQLDMEEYHIGLGIFARKE
jgi:hypothetical protein